MKKFKLVNADYWFNNAITYDTQIILHLNAGSVPNHHFAETIVDILNEYNKSFPYITEEIMKIKIKEWKKK